MVLSKEWIEKWANEYNKVHEENNKLEDKIIKQLESNSSPPDYLTTADLIDITEWKSPRTVGHVKKNDDKYVKAVTKVSLEAHSSNERLMLDVLTLLHGVQIRVASAILYFCFPEEYTTMDRRAWKALKDLRILKVDIKDDFEHWKMYNKACLKTAKDNIVPLRELDKALWVLGGKK